MILVCASSELIVSGPSEASGATNPQNGLIIRFLKDAVS